jgi:hypothetical protein
MQNEGEGSRTAAKAYNEGVAKTIQSGKVDQKAHEAEAAIEGPEGEELRRAEAEGKRHSHGEDPGLKPGAKVTGKA